MSRIRRLPDELINKIAAGEVVERPASVLKELLENAIDADAGAVSVDLKDAGRQLIRVTDDGVGMTADELTLALERHATSKVGSEADLEAIGTLGFRGEAFPAICSVSRFTILSAPRGSSRGTLVRGEGGAITERLAVEAAAGTSVEIFDLFFNTPARLKFLKHPQSELALALRVASHLALAHPRLRVQVTHNGKSVLTAPPVNTLRDRVAAFLGYEWAGQLLDLLPGESKAVLTGLISPPHMTRGGRDWIVIIVNGRPVSDALLRETLLEAYRPLLARDRFPVAALMLALPPQEVDVNVHPAKAWVRFREPRLVQEAVFRAVQAALRSGEVLQSPRSGTPGSRGAGLTPADTGAPGIPAPAGSEGAQPSLFREEVSPYGPSLFGQPVGQVEETFIVAANQEEVFFIDQHVAHERVLFERLKAELASGPLPSQELLLAEPLTLGPASRSLLSRWLPTLEELGFALEEFGGGTLLLRGVPSLLKGEEPHRLIEALLEEVGTAYQGATAPLVDRALSFVACRAAIKANRPLDHGEMRRLLADLSTTETPYFCPHGRPILSRVSLREIKRELRRTW
ncbi:MAG: DNA mismatch repair endonuclease MutL [Candidatus Methylomirabilia bacterium]